MPLKNETVVKRATEQDLEVGAICADRDGNRVRIDQLDRGAATLAFHFLNDELRVQEGVRELTIEQFIAEGWYVGASGSSL